MEKFFKRNILDELYELKGDDFGNKIMQELAKQNKQLNTFKVDEKITEKIKEVVTDEEKQSEILDLLNEYELKSNDDDDFWNKMYYKLGAYDCARMSEVVKTEVKERGTKIEETKTVFFDEYSDDFYDYLNTNRVRMLKENAEYKELEVKREKIKADNPNIRAIFEDREAVQLTQDEVKAVLDMLEIEGDINTIETIENFKLGAREMLLFLKQMRLL